MRSRLRFRFRGFERGRSLHDDDRRMLLGRSERAHHADTLPQLNDAFDRRPTPSGDRAPVRNVSHDRYDQCEAPVPGSTLAVLRVERLRLAPAIETALAVQGVWIDVVDGVETRVSVTGDNLFVLLSEIAQSADAGTTI